MHCHDTKILTDVRRGLRRRVSGPETLSARAVIADLYVDILVLRKSGKTLRDVHKILVNGGVSIAYPTLKSYMCLEAARRRKSAGDNGREPAQATPDGPRREPSKKPRRRKPTRSAEPPGAAAPAPVADSPVPQQPTTPQQASLLEPSGSGGQTRVTSRTAGLFADDDFNTQSF